MVARSRAAGPCWGCATASDILEARRASQEIRHHSQRADLRPVFIAGGNAGLGLSREDVAGALRHHRGLVRGEAAL